MTDKQLQTMLAAGMLLALSAPHLDANGALRNGNSPRAQGKAGADVAEASDPIGAMSVNPAGLTSQRRTTFQVGMTAVTANGSHRNTANPETDIRSRFGAVPDFGLATPVGNLPVVVGLALTTDSALEGRWQLIDPPGGLGGATSYGRQEYRSKFLILRTGLGFGARINDRLSIGGSAGLIYNDNTLVMPYVFQSHPALTGLKTLFRMSSDGFGWNGQLGLIWKASDTLRFGVSYRTETTIKANGKASGNAGAQFAALGGAFAAFRPDFNYNVEVENVLPRLVSAGFLWSARPDTRVSFQLDWINWSQAFDNLPVVLTGGDNADINGLLGTSQINDFIPLNWRDRLVYRLGLEHDLNENWRVRLGYSYGENPVPAATTTPLTAAIFEHTVAVGASYVWSRYNVDLAYQHDFSNERAVGTSGMAAGEFNNSSTRVGLHSLGLAFGMTF